MADNKNAKVEEVNESNFFRKYNEESEFLLWESSVRDEDIAELEKALALRKRGKKITKTTVERPDFNGSPYTQITFLKSAGVSDSAKWVLNGPWRQVLEDIEDNLIKINFTVRGLIAAAKKAQEA